MSAVDDSRGNAVATAEPAASPIPNTALSVVADARSARARRWSRLEFASRPLRHGAPAWASGRRHQRRGLGTL